MKIYDKNLYKSQENIRTVIIVIVAFLLGFFAGYFTNSYNHQNPSDSNNIVNENGTRTAYVSYLS